MGTRGVTMSRRWAFVAALAALVATLVALPCVALAQGRPLVVDDEANLLTDSQEKDLTDVCAPLGEYVDTAFVSVTDNPRSTEQFCYDYVNRPEFRDAPTVIFCIDMDNREIYVYSNKPGLAFVSQADSRAITDNVYRMASAGDYYGCAKTAFEQVLVKCEGGRIARPVKHITNALIAVCVAILANFLLVLASRRELSERQRKEMAKVRVSTIDGVLVSKPIITEKNRYRRQKSAGGRYAGGFGGGGGGGFSGGGGGGGHKF